MKKMIVFAFVMTVLAGFVSAGTVTVSLVATNGQSIQYSDPVNISGILDKIEVVQTSGCTATVTVATFSGTTAIETFASLTTLVGNKVVRPRVLPTDNTGASLAAVTNALGTVSTFLSVPYSRPTIGGNVKVAVTPSGSSTTGTGTNTVICTFYYDKAPLVAW